jgi:hypothetical protein
MTTVSLSQRGIGRVPGRATAGSSTGIETRSLSNLARIGLGSGRRRLFEHFSAEDLPGDDGQLLRVLKLNDMRSQRIRPME